LAEGFGKSKWGMAILGVVSFYAAQIVLGIVLGLIVGVNEDGTFIGINDLAISLIGVAFGILCCYILYQILKKSWESRSIYADSELLDEDLI